MNRRVNAANHRRLVRLLRRCRPKQSQETNRCAQPSAMHHAETPML
jgi:hypothetical protein